MKKTILLSLLALITICSFTSCKEDDYNIEFPIWKGFTLSKTTVTPFDTLIMKCHLDKGGKNLYNTHYICTMIIDTISQENIIQPMAITYDVASNASNPIHMNDEPSMYFPIPKNPVPGTKNRRFIFEVKYSNAVDGAPVSYTTQVKDGFLGNEFKNEVQSTLYSHTTSNFNYPISIEDYCIILPRWKGFKLPSTTITKGDTLVLNAFIDKPGMYIDSTRYICTMKIDTISLNNEIKPMLITSEIKNTPNHPIQINNNPSFYFPIPQNAVKGTSNVEFTFEVKYNNLIYGNPDTYKSQVHDGYLGNEFTYQIQSVLYSHTTCNFNHTITIQ